MSDTFPAAPPDEVLTTGVLSRLDVPGQPVIRLPDTRIRLRPATPPSEVDWRSLEGLDVGECGTGTPPALQLDVPLASVNELFLLMRGQAGQRAEDSEPLSLAVLDRLRQQGWDRTPFPCTIELAVSSRRAPASCTVMRLGQVHLHVDRASVCEGPRVRRILLQAQLHEDFLQPFAPLVGFAGKVSRHDSTGSRM